MDRAGSVGLALSLEIDSARTDESTLVFDDKKKRRPERNEIVAKTSHARTNDRSDLDLLILESRHCGNIT